MKFYYSVSVTRALIQSHMRGLKQFNFGFDFYALGRGERNIYMYVHNT